MKQGFFFEGTNQAGENQGTETDSASGKTEGLPVRPATAGSRDENRLSSHNGTKLCHKAEQFAIDAFRFPRPCGLWLVTID